MYAGYKYETHYTVWTAWISIMVRVWVWFYFKLQNLAPLALPYMCPSPGDIILRSETPGGATYSMGLSSVTGPYTVTTEK